MEGEGWEECIILYESGYVGQERYERYRHEMGMTTSLNDGRRSCIQIAGLLNASQRLVRHDSPDLKTAQPAPK
jgi:hypothetical protein